MIQKRGGLLDEGCLLIVGAFPPPLHGMSAVNSAVRSTLEAAGAQPVVINVSAESLDRALLIRLCRLPRILRGATILLFKKQRSKCVLYTSISAGLGQVYDVLFVVLARLRGMRVYLHHHSFSYIDKPNSLTRLLTVVAGSIGTHITLSPGMAGRFKALYPYAKSVVAISNAVVVPCHISDTYSVRSNLATLGFISNISEEKGIFEVLELAAALQADGLKIRTILAGPFQDSDTERRVRARLELLHYVDYVGPQYGHDKEIFFASIDALIFPSFNEAEPVTIHEAMQRAIPVIAYGRGCIPEIVSSGCGLVVDPATPFVPAALAQIKQWLGQADKYSEASGLARKKFMAAYEENACRWQNLIHEILGRATSGDTNCASEEG